jgi:hypothetical protein
MLMILIEKAQNYEYVDLTTIFNIQSIFIR